MRERLMLLTSSLAEWQLGDHRCFQVFNSSVKKNVEKKRLAPVNARTMRISTLCTASGAKMNN